MTAKEIRQATCGDLVLSRVIEFTGHGWPSEIEDLRLKPYFNR